MNDEIITSYLLGKKAGGGGTPPVYQDKEVSITQNGTTTITKDSGYDALNSVELTVNVPQPSGKISITQNGTDIDVSSYASADVNVPAGADLSEYFDTTVSRGQSTAGSAGWMKLVKKLPDLTTSGTRLDYCFYGSSITSLPNISGINNVIYFDNFCQYCRGLVNVDLSNWQFSTSIADLSSMFQDCSNLEEINLSSITTMGGDKKLSSMFQSCSKLKKVNLSNLEPAPYGNYSSINNMFSGCTALEELDISSMTMPTRGFSNAFSNVSDNCLILVKDQTAKDWFTTNWSSLTNVQIKSEYIANQGA